MADKKERLSLGRLRVRSFMTSEDTRYLEGGSLLSGGGCDDSWLQATGCRVTEAACKHGLVSRMC